MAPDEAARSTVEVGQSIHDARLQSAESPDGTYRELMATYVVLGELLESGRTDQEFVQECKALADRVVVLGRVQGRELQQRWAAWLSTYTTLGGEDW